MNAKMILGLIVVIVSIASSGNAQEFTLTTTNANTVSSKASIDMPGLTGNPMAIIVATPVGGTSNPHPIGAWYYSGKWNLFNTDHAVMPLGAKYRVQFFLQPGPNQFLHLITQQNLGSEGSYIDHPALNNNPNAQVQIFQNHSPDVRSGSALNSFEARAAYSSAAGRWYITNVNNELLRRGGAYNIVVSSGAVGANTNPQNPKNPETSAKPPDSAGVPSQTNPVSQPVQPGTIEKDTTPRDSAKVAVPSQNNTPPGRDWTLRPEPSPTVAPNADIILFIHGMDSRAEEADDITKALFELMANGPQSQQGPPPPPAGAQFETSLMIPVLQQLLQKYKGCIRERYETQQDMRNRGLDGNLSGLLSTDGLQDRDANVMCLAGNLCSLLNRIESLGMLQAQADRGDAKNFEETLKRAIPKDCFECSKHQEMHTKHVHCTMEAGGNNGLLKGPIFEACKAGVDIEALANNIIRNIRQVMTNARPQTQATGGPSVATNFSTVQFNSCPDPAGGCPEPCSNLDNFSGGQRTAVLPSESVDRRQVPLYYEPLIPLGLLDTTPPPSQQFDLKAPPKIGNNEGRLIPQLRKAAADQTHLASLRLAAYEFAAGDTIMGRAYADLSVTGHRAFHDFRLALPKEDFCQSLRGQQPQLNDGDVLEGCRKALDRAYKVANFLRTGQRGDTPAEKTRKTNERIDLGWIAVSGEDDSPHRPVNVPSSDFPQYDIDVVVEAPLAARPEKTVTVRTRYVIAQSPPIRNTGKSLVVISLDLPTSGYSVNLNYEEVSPLSEIGNPKWTPVIAPIIIPNELLYVVAGVPPLPPGPITVFPDFQATGKTPLLDFIENHIVRFAEAVDGEVSGAIKNKIKGVMGGSLGGNMTFRLGRRPDVPWLPKFIVWSPASIWNSLGEGSDVLKHLGPRKGWEGANQANKAPGVGDRAEFFRSWDKPILPVIIPMAQSDTWTSDYYPCKKSSIAAARLDRHETYDARFLAWHWRLGAEQLLYSHQTIDPATNKPRYMSNQKPMLLACGTEDHVKFNDICPATMSTAPLMTLTPGKALFLDKTGHSLDNERRSYWARQIIEFLGLQ